MDTLPPAEKERKTVKQQRTMTDRIMDRLRRVYRIFWRRQLRNRNMTIIANNCCAGMMYHDLGQRFDSPTINLWIPDGYFFEFLNHLEHYVHSAPEQVFLDGIQYPVGRITRGESEIIIHFIHYDSFDAARQKWLERGRRINRDNLYIVFNTTENSYIDQFLKLKYKHKVMLTRCEEHSPVPEHVVDMPVYRHSVASGIILSYKSPCSFRRWLDDFDYVSFLNRT